MGQYWHWLAVASAFFLVAERIAPWHRPHETLRQGWLRDLGFLVLNGHVFSAFVAVGISMLVYEQTTAILISQGVNVEQAVAQDWPLWLQFVAFLVLSDFVQWCTHLCLHKIPFLWAFHKVHHSIPRLDWAANFHFHWMEIFVYSTTRALPWAWLGADQAAMNWVFVAGTFWGHFNHSNLPVSIGPLRYIFNSPKMHQWHHDASDEGGVSKNYGIVLSVWDWLFRTVHWPADREPQRLGYPGDDEMPQSFGGQMLWPLSRLRALRFFRG